MSTIDWSLKNMVFIGCSYVTFQIPSLLADSTATDFGLVLNGLGFSVHEACVSDKANGQCWLQSIRFALEHSQKYGLKNESPVSHANILRTVLNHLNQYADTEIFTDWQPAHQLNALLAQEWNLSILTIEVSELGLLHIVLTKPSDRGYEQQVIFYGEIENLLASDLQIAQTLQQLLLTADISLVLTPGHVQPVILTPSDNSLNELNILLPLQEVNSPARMLMLSELMSYTSSSEWRLRPDFDALYGAVRKQRSTEGQSELKKTRKEKADEYQKYKAFERRWKFINRSIKSSVMLLTAGTGYIYRESIIRFIQPYWNNRAQYYDMTIKVLNHWKESLKDYSDRFVAAVYPFWESVRTVSEALINRYYWLQDTSACIEGAKIVLQSDENGSFRAKGIITDQTVDLLVDSGATSVSMNTKIARKLGVSDFIQRGALTKCHTASHLDIPCYRILLPSVQVGCIKLFNVDAIVMESENDEILLGMSFLNRLNWSKKGRFLELQAD